MITRALSLEPTSWTCWDYAVLAGGKQVGFVKPLWWKQSAEVNLDGAEYRFERKGLMRPKYAAYRDGKRLVSGETQHFMAMRIDLQVGDDRYRLEPEGFWAMHKLLRDASGATVLRIGPEGWFGLKSRLDADPELPLLVAVFVGWIVRSQHQASAGGAAC